MRCPNCGAHNPDAGQWCGACGYTLKRKQGLLIVVSVWLLIGTVVNIINFPETISSLLFLMRNPYAGVKSFLLMLLSFSSLAYIVMCVLSTIFVFICIKRRRSRIPRMLGIILLGLAVLICMEQAFLYVTHAGFAFLAVLPLSLVPPILFLVGINRYNGNTSGQRRQPTEENM